MPVKRIRRKIEHLRTQPEHVRYRAAVIMTGATGSVIAILWLTILLPLQLRLGQDRGREAEPVAAARQEQQQAVVPPPAGGPAERLSKSDIFDWTGTTSTVSGIQDVPTETAPATPSDPSGELIPAAPTSSSPSPTPSPTPSADAPNLIEDPGSAASPSPSPSPSPASLPVEVTN